MDGFGYILSPCISRILRGCLLACVYGIWMCVRAMYKLVVHCIGKENAPLTAAVLAESSRVVADSRRNGDVENNPGSDLIVQTTAVSAATVQSEHRETEIAPEWRTGDDTQQPEPGSIAETTLQSVPTVLQRIAGTSGSFLNPPRSIHIPSAFEVLVVHRIEAEHEEGQHCAICIDDVWIRSTLMLICGHRFHLDCVTQWLHRAPSACCRSARRLSPGSKYRTTRDIETVIEPAWMRAVGPPAEEPLCLSKQLIINSQCQSDLERTNNPHVQIKRIPLLKHSAVWRTFASL